MVYTILHPKPFVEKKPKFLAINKNCTCLFHALIKISQFTGYKYNEGGVDQNSCVISSKR